MCLNRRLLAEKVMCLFLAFVAFGVARAFQNHDSTHPEFNIKEATKRLSDDSAPYKDVVNVCVSFIKKLGYPVPQGIRVSVDKIVLPGHTTLYSVSFKGCYALAINGSRDSVEQFEVLTQYRIKLSKSASLIRPISNDPISIRSYCSNFAKRLGISECYKVSSIRTRKQDYNEFGGEEQRCTVEYSASHQGYPIKGYDNYALNFDLMTGLVSAIFRPQPKKNTIESSKAALTFAQASEIATKIARKYDVGKYRKGETQYSLNAKPKPSEEPSQLEYILPNGEFGGLNYPFKAPYKLRLAWVLRYPRNEAIFIDADDGKCLGGWYHRPK